MKVGNRGDIMFYELNLEIMFFTLISLVLSTRIIVDTVWPR